MEFTRREVVHSVIVMFGGAALLDVDGFLRRYADEAPRTAAMKGVGPFTGADIAFLDEVAETILPETSTPGAKAARTGAFMALMVTDSYGDTDQKLFRDGMTSLDAECRRMHGRPFMKASAAERTALLESLDKAQFEHNRTRAKDAPDHYFRKMKWLALQGYFTSEIGCTQAMRYVETPGRFDPCVPHEAGERIWAGHA